jgi:hypothetical protein
MSRSGHSDEKCSQRVSDEIEALSAIYGDDKVSFSEDTGALNVSLLTCPDVSMSCMLPKQYPESGKPLRVSLRVESMVRARCEMIVEDVLTKVHAVEDSDGECLFEYCQGILDALKAEEVDNSEGLTDRVGSSADVSRGGLAPGSHYFGDGEDVMHGVPLTEKRSVFQAHAARVYNVEAAREFAAWLTSSFSKLASATHHVMAYRVSPAQDFDDDGEGGAGKGLLFTLQQMDVDNMVVVVSRWYGGTKLGPARFKLINNAARQLLSDKVCEKDAQ